MDDLRARHDLEDAIEDAALGEVVAAGSGLGVMDIHVAVEALDAARTAIQEVIAKKGLMDVVSFVEERPVEAPPWG